MDPINEEQDDDRGKSEVRRQGGGKWRAMHDVLGTTSLKAREVNHMAVE